MLALLVAEATNTPVWWLVMATASLVVVTGVLAFAAWRALGQLKVAVDQLEEVKRDRHVEVFSDMGRRWSGPEMTEACQIEEDYTPKTLRRLFELGAKDSHRGNPIQRHRRRQAQKARVVLLRIPNYFEEAATIAEAGVLKAELMDDYFGGVARDEWALWSLTIKKLQETDKLAFVKFEDLARRAD